jgi:predicted unusual protein kinase regulating ubiquinone biosynthesis (AarF/ABC1/UbiB family)
MNYLNIEDYGTTRQERLLEEAEKERLAKEAREGEEKETLRHRIGTTLVKLGQSLSEQPKKVGDPYSDYRI